MGSLDPTSAEAPARFAFATTSAVSTAREHSRFVLCPACQSDSPSYLFHRSGVRFVRCTSCEAVYVNPARQHPLNDLDIERLRPFSNPRDRALIVADFGRLLEHLEADYRVMTGAPLERVLLLGRHLREFAALPQGRRVGLAVAEPNDHEFEQ